LGGKSGGPCVLLDEAKPNVLHSEHGRASGMVRDAAA
jgi:hypothetical protein